MFEYTDFLGSMEGGGMLVRMDPTLLHGVK
jgi:hypothetical protein